MSIYIFTLMVGYVFGGVDSAQGYRARMLENLPCPVKYIFTELPRRRDILRYKEVGIKEDQMLIMHQYFTDHPKVELRQKVKDKLDELKKSLHFTEVESVEDEIRLIRNKIIVARILLDLENKEYFWGIHYFDYIKLVRTEFYTDRIAYVNYYVTAESDQGLYAKLVKRTFYNKDGSVAYNQLFEGEKEWFSFSDGRLYTKLQFFIEFIKKLNLQERDVIILDRPAIYDFLQPIFQFKNNARLIVILHSRHFFEKGEDPYDIYLNREYIYCFKHSKTIDTIVVSTHEQKQELAEKLLEYQYSVPKITVIPAGGIEYFRYPDTERYPYSLITVSRIERLKKIEWIIKGVIKAHQVNTDIFIDIYGNDEGGYLQYLQDMVLQNQAQSYIHFMGRRDVTEVYKNYEVYITASLGESLGLSLMEAVASGMAMIGLDVKYGNRLFIRPEENGYLIDFHIDYVYGKDEELTDAIAEKILEIFADEERMKEFHKKSYEIAKDFSSEIIEKKWRKLLL